jgi:hypothetical protein
MVTKREGTTNRCGFLANGLSLAGAPVRLAQPVREMSGA